jgi:hypothetical protein
MSLNDFVDTENTISWRLLFPEFAGNEKGTILKGAWNNLERAKDILEHVYLAGLIDSRKNDTISCTLDDMLKMEGLTRYGMVQHAMGEVTG